MKFIYLFISLFVSWQVRAGQASRCTEAFGSSDLPKIETTLSSRDVRRLTLLVGTMVLSAAGSSYLSSALPAKLSFISTFVNEITALGFFAFGASLLEPLSSRFRKSGFVMRNPNAKFNSWIDQILEALWTRTQEAHSLNAQMSRNVLNQYLLLAHQNFYEAYRSTQNQNFDHAADQIAVYLVSARSPALVINRIEGESKTNKILISAVGDIIVHRALYLTAVARGKSFYFLGEKVADYFHRSDIVYANLEGPTALGVDAGGKDHGDIGFVYDQNVYSGHNFLFNYHPSLVDDLINWGIGVVSTANNHAYDRGPLGIDKTVENLRNHRIQFTGTRKRNEESDYLTVTVVRGYRIGWLSCAEMLNGFTDRYNQVLSCRDPSLLNAVSSYKQALNLDLLFITPHWGEEYKRLPNEFQKTFGRELLNAGADAVLGTHPHVLEPWEVVHKKDGRNGFIIYSLGNFITGQTDFPARTSIILQLEATRGSDGRAVLTNASYIPIYRGHGEAQVQTFSSNMDPLAWSIVTSSLGAPPSE